MTTAIENRYKIYKKYRLLFMDNCKITNCNEKEKFIFISLLFTDSVNDWKESSFKFLIRTIKIAIVRHKILSWYRKVFNK